MKRFIFSAVMLSALAALANAQGSSDSSKLTVSATVDIQVDKKMYDENYAEIANDYAKYNRFQSVLFLRKAVDDYWLRGDLKILYTSALFENSLVLRVFPKFTLKQRDFGPEPEDLRYIPLFDLIKAYLKVRREYSGSQLFLKLGRDEMLNTCGQLFGNYLENPVGGYGAKTSSNIIGPFKNRAVSANQIEVGARLNFSDMLESRTSVIVGGNLNNDQWYSSGVPAIYELMDSRLNGKFYRAYQDFYLFDNRIHAGAGYRNYSTMGDSDNILIPLHFINAAVAFDAVIFPGMKIYTEFGYQKLGQKSRTGIMRPVLLGLTIPTGGALDQLGIELENAGETYISSKSTRDNSLGRVKTVALAYGLTAEKRFAQRCNVAWAIYPGNAYGDLTTSLRISTYF